MLDLLQEDKAKHKDGSPFYIYDMTFFVQRFGTKESKEQIESIKNELYGPFCNPKDIDEDRVFAIWLCEFGVTGWHNVKYEDGEFVEYSKAEARKIFLDSQYWLSLNKAILIHCTNFENYLHDLAYEESEELKKP